LAPEKAEKPALPRTLDGRAGEQDGATAARHHDLGHLAAHQEAGKAAHLPHLEVDAGGGLADGKRTLAPMLKAATSMGADLALDGVDERHHLLLLAGIRAEGAGLAALALDAATKGASLSALRRVTQAVKPSRANLRAIAPPVASPAPMTRATFAFAICVP
jgi:hypothetical protein